MQFNQAFLSGDFWRLLEGSLPPKGRLFANSTSFSGKILFPNKFTYVYAAKKNGSREMSALKNEQRKWLFVVKK